VAPEPDIGSRRRTPTPKVRKTSRHGPAGAGQVVTAACPARSSAGDLLDELTDFTLGDLLTAPMAELAEVQDALRRSADRSARTAGITAGSAVLAMGVAVLSATLKTQKVHPAEGRTLSEAAVDALTAVDTIRENLR
jgi:hypothetical protein